jgi:ribonuclease D
VAIRDDIKGLQKISHFNPSGFIELATLSDKAGISHNGLRGLAATILGGKMSKKAKLTNWQSKTLNPEQIVYAATDAWVGREIYLKLKDFHL